jgi:hypothetical protein
LRVLWRDLQADKIGRAILLWQVQAASTPGRAMTILLVASFAAAAVLIAASVVMGIE